MQRVANVRFIIVGGDNSHQDGFQKKLAWITPPTLHANIPI
ncbi:MAG: hypothetical protein M5U34_40810 [Chloroflexi bacterium]|nr:hypothetical protein [Chloroflexota bacterium]